MIRLSHALAALSLLAALAPATAAAAPPANDARTAPQQLGSLPASVRGTTVDATLDGDEPFPACSGSIKNSVWYAFRATSSREILAALDAGGDMDAVVEVFERRRSQVSSVACQTTNRRGEATVDFDATDDTDYLVRVAPLANSVAESFSLRVVVPDEPAQPPGRPLPAGGMNASVDRFANADDAWSAELTKGVTYRINFVTSSTGCAELTLFPPGIGEFDVAALRTLRCDRYTVFTPPRSGRYSLRVRAPRASRARLDYRLRVGRAGADDTAPGISLANDRRVRGGLRGSELDALDLYRFSVARRSDLRVRLRTRADFDVILLSGRGARRACGCGGAGDKEFELRMRPGRYFLAVRARNGADGSYRLSRLARTITRSRMRVNGAGGATVAPGATVDLTQRVTPAVAGAATLVVERFDPIGGWLFDAGFHPRVSGGAATVAFRPASVGRWRVTGSFDGTRTASASQGGAAFFNVQEPLEE